MERCSGSPKLADLKVEVGWYLEEFSQPARPGLVHSMGVVEAASGIVHLEGQVEVYFDQSLHSLQPGLAHPDDPMASLTLPKLARLVWGHFHSACRLARYHARNHPVVRAQSLEGPISEGGGATSSKDWGFAMWVSSHSPSLATAGPTRRARHLAVPSAASRICPRRP